MKSIFLGLGKVNNAIAKHIADEKIAFVEEEGGLRRQDWLGKSWSAGEIVSKDLDSYDWKIEGEAEFFVSPGIDPRRKFFKQIEKSEKRELDFFCEKFKGKVLAVTGTDGKSTFTSQLGEILIRANPNKKIFVGGNLGTAMGDALAQNYDWAILEISSFQAETVEISQAGCCNPT